MQTLLLLLRLLRFPLLRLTLVGPLVAATLTACAVAQPSVSPGLPSTQAEELRVLAVDDAHVAAEVARDEPAMRGLIDDRFVFNADDGTTSDKEAFLKRVLKLPQVGQTVRERSMLIEGDIAVVFATADIRLAMPGKPKFIYAGRYTCAEVKRQGLWRMLALPMQDRAAKLSK